MDRGPIAPPVATAAENATYRPAGPWPKAAASAAIFRDGAVLLGERGKGPRGVWSLPGGHIEPGETAAAAAAREILEETGVTATILGLVDMLDVIRHRDDGTLLVHYVLNVFYGEAGPGEPVAASDCADARFVPLAEIGRYPLTADARRVIQAAARLLSARE